MPFGSAANTNRTGRFPASGSRTRDFKPSPTACRAQARQQLRVTLSLSGAERMDIRTTRGEIDYVASDRGIDPRGIDRANGSDACQR